MHVQLLIDEIVRQTTVLIAQVSTATGLRAPLASIADQVFLELARELEAQGVRRTVVADMFGLALRSYQLKFQRLSESQQADSSLWQDVHKELSQGVRTKDELQKKLRLRTSSEITTVLNDLVGSGLAFASGRGPSGIYGLTSEQDLKRLTQVAEEQAVTQWVWQLVATGRANTRQQLERQLNVAPEVLTQTLTSLIDEGKLAETEGELAAERLDIPVGAEQGWEAAVGDHFRAVATAIAAKLKYGKSKHGERLGGGTYTFTVHPQHPHETKVYELLARTRSELESLWGDVTQWNDEHPPPDDASKVTFYFGQHLTQSDLE